MMMMGLLGSSLALACVFFFLPTANGQDIETYFVNKNFHLETTIPNESPDIECPVTEGQFPFPTEITLCFRSRPLVYIHHARTGFSWRTVITFGRMVGTKFEEGILFGVYYGGPWVGLKIPGTESIAWLFGGDALARFPFQVWRQLASSSSSSSSSRFGGTLASPSIATPAGCVSLRTVSFGGTRPLTRWSRR